MNTITKQSGLVKRIITANQADTTLRRADIIITAGEPSGYLNWMLAEKCVLLPKNEIERNQKIMLVMLES
jgi:hypothetical protein